MEKVSYHTANKWQTGFNLASLFWKLKSLNTTLLALWTYRALHYSPRLLSPTNWTHAAPGCLHVLYGQFAPSQLPALLHCQEISPPQLGPFGFLKITFKNENGVKLFTFKGKQGYKSRWKRLFEKRGDFTGWQGAAPEAREETWKSKDITQPVQPDLGFSGTHSWRISTTLPGLLMAAQSCSVGLQSNPLEPDNQRGRAGAWHSSTQPGTSLK